MSNNPYNEGGIRKFLKKPAVLSVFFLSLLAVGAGTAVSSKTKEIKEENLKRESEELKGHKSTVEERVEKNLEEIKIREEKEKEEPIEKVLPKEDEQKAEPVSQKVVKATYPCQGEIIEGFSKGELVKDITMGDWRTHNGIDISCEEGQVIKASLSGKVKEVFNDPLWGTVMIIEHGEALTTKYCGLMKETSKEAGETVNQGETIGKLGTIPGESKEQPHLHFEVIRGGKYLDPEEFLG